MNKVRNTACLLGLVIGLGIGQGFSQPTAEGTGQLLIMRGSTLYVRDESGKKRQKLAEDVKAAVLSPDGKLAAYADAKGIKIADLKDGSTLTLVSIAQGFVRGLIWSPGQKAIAYDLRIPSRGEDLYLAPYPTRGGTPRRLAVSYGGISFSPDGKYILHVNPAAKEGSAGSVLERIDTESGRVETVYAPPSLIEEAEYSPDGSRIALLIPNESSETDDGTSCAPPPNSIWILGQGISAPVKLDLKSVGNPAVSTFSWSPDSKRLAFDSGGAQCDFPGSLGDVFLTSLDKGATIKLSEHVPSRNPIFSPDGKKVLFTDFSRVYKNGPQVVMVADLIAHKLEPLAGQVEVGAELDNYDMVVDWK